MKLKPWYIIIIMLTLLSLLGILSYDYSEDRKRACQQIKIIGRSQDDSSFFISGERRDQFSYIAVAIDGTGSMVRGNAFNKAKEIVRNQIIPQSGIGDRVVCYSIDPKFDIDNFLFGDTDGDQLPQLDKEEAQMALTVLQQIRTPPPRGIAPKAFCHLHDLLRLRWERVKKVQDQWGVKIDELQPASPGGSDYGGFLRSMADTFEAMPPEEDKWLFIVGDLIDQPAYARLASSAGVSSKAFREVNIVNIYPDNASHDYDQIIARTWGSSPSQARFKSYSFAAVSGQRSVLKANPVSGLAGYQIKNFRDIFPSHWKECLVVLAVAALFIFGDICRDYFRRRSSPEVLLVDQVDTPTEEQKPSQ